jgi:hypothetical protein
MKQKLAVNLSCMRQHNRAFASPHVIAQSKLKQAPEASSQLATPDEEITPVVLSNDRQVTKTIQSIVSVYARSTDWDVRLDAVKQALAILRGGAVNFISFVRRERRLSNLGACSLRSSPRSLRSSTPCQSSL